MPRFALLATSSILLLAVCLMIYSILEPNGNLADGNEGSRLTLRFFSIPTLPCSLCRGGINASMQMPVVVTRESFMIWILITCVLYILSTWKNPTRLLYVQIATPGSGWPSS